MRSMRANFSEALGQQSSQIAGSRVRPKEKDAITKAQESTPGEDIDEEMNKEELEEGRVII